MLHQAESVRRTPSGMEINMLWLVFVVLAVFVVYVIAKVLMYMRQSDAQWQQVDISKLKTWEDDEDD